MSTTRQAFRGLMGSWEAPQGTNVFHCFPEIQLHGCQAGVEACSLQLWFRHLFDGPIPKGFRERRAIEFWKLPQTAFNVHLSCREEAVRSVPTDIEATLRIFDLCLAIESVSCRDETVRSVPTTFEHGFPLS